MQTQAAERSRQTGRSRGTESGERRGETRGRSARSSVEERARLISTMQQKEQRAADRGSRNEEEERASSRRAASEGRGGGGGEESERRRRRISELEKERLELRSSHNQEVCRLQAELTRLRSVVERGEAQRVELQYQLTVSQRDATRLTEKEEELQLSLQEVQKALDITQHALQQEVEERDRLIQSCSSENRRLLTLIQDHNEALQEAERRMAEVQKEREKEVEVNRRQAGELKYLKEREERSRREKEVCEQKVRSLQEEVQEERAAHQESRFQSELLQRRGRGLEEALALERSSLQEVQSGLKEAQSDLKEAQSNLELLKSKFGEVERAHGLERERRSRAEGALERLQKEYHQCRSDLSGRLEEVAQQVQEVQEENQKLQEENQVVQEENQKLQEENQEVQEENRRLKEENQKENWMLKEENQRLKEENQEVQEENQMLKEENHILQEENQKENRMLKEENQRLQEENQEVQKDNRTLKEENQKENQRLQEENQEVQKENQTLKEENHILQEENQKENRMLKEENQRLQEENQEVQKDNRTLKEENQKENQRLQEENQEVQKENQTLKEENRRLKEENYTRKKENQEVQKENQTLKEENQEVQKENRTLNRLTSDQSQRLEVLQEELEREREQRAIEVNTHQEERTTCLSFLHSVLQRLLAGCVLLRQPQCILGNFTWEELCDVITQQVDQVTSDLRTANDTIARLQGVCDRKSVCVREQECVLSRLEEEVRRREEAWSQRHTHTVTQLQACRSRCSSLQEVVTSLTSDLSRLRGLLTRSRRDSNYFLSACSLVGGAMRHTHTRLQSLCDQKCLLLRRLAVREELEEEVRRLVSALQGEEEEERGRSRRGAEARRRWRRSVCVVAAVRRWRSMTSQSSVLMWAELSGGETVGVCHPQTGKEDGGDKGAWLHSKRLSAVILTAMNHLQRPTHTGSAPSDVMSSARSSLSRLLDHFLHQSDAALSPSPRQTDEAPPPNANATALVSALHRHFLLFSQRLHSAEVERRSLRLELANQKRGESCRTVPLQRFHSVCVELRRSLSREQEVQTLVQEHRHGNRHQDTQRRLTHTTQSLVETQQEVSRLKRALRIVGKRLVVVQRDRKHLKEELNNTNRRRDCLISNMKAAESTYRQVREGLLQAPRLRPLPLPREHLAVCGPESMLGAPELGACQSLLSSLADLVVSFSSRIHFLEQEAVSCLRGNGAFVPVPVTFLETEADPDKELSISLNPAPLMTKPRPLLGSLNHAP